MIKGSVTVEARAFTAAVKWAARFLDARPSVPIQGGLLLDAAGDGRLSVLGYNEALTARAVVEAGGDGAGQAVVFGRLLAALAGTFPAKPVTISGDGDETVVIKAGSWEGTLPCMEPGDFASPPPPPAVIGTVLGDDLAQLVRRVAVARSDSDKASLRWHLMTLEFGDGTATGLATDSHRAARATAAFEGAAGGRALLHSATALEVAEAFTGPDEVHVGLSEGSIGFASPTRAVIMRQTADQEYPYAGVRGLFAGDRREHAVVAVAPIQEALKRAELMRDGKNPIAVAFGPDLIRIAASSEQLNQRGVDEIEAKYAGPAMEVLFNPGYLGEALASAPGDTVVIALQSDKPGVVITVPRNEDWRHLLMPIKK